MPKLHVDVTLDPETLVALDAYGAARSLSRGSAIRELLNLAAGGAELVAPATAGQRLHSERMRNGQALPPGVNFGARGLGREPVAGRVGGLQPGERVVDPDDENPFDRSEGYPGGDR